MSWKFTLIIMLSCISWPQIHLICIGMPGVSIVLIIIFSIAINILYWTQRRFRKVLRTLNLFYRVKNIRRKLLSYHGCEVDYKKIGKLFISYSVFCKAGSKTLGDRYGFCYFIYIIAALNLSPRNNLYLLT